mmetsp:Transcript_14958/g.18839  ORF Transcript_14958/g.18839 Transcript_14958/m.18839 type:complete len:149 (+) Transcript_14958:29-475(+)
MSLCDIFPDDPSCAAPVDDTDTSPDTTDPVDDGKDQDQGKDQDVEDGDAEDGDGEAGEGDEGDAEAKQAVEKVDYSEAASKAVADWQRVKDMSNQAMISNPMGAHLMMMGAVLPFALSGALEAFRYRSKTGWYTTYKIGTSETFKLQD